MSICVSIGVTFHFKQDMVLQAELMKILKTITKLLIKTAAGPLKRNGLPQNLC